MKLNYGVVQCVLWQFHHTAQAFGSQCCCTEHRHEQHCISACNESLSICLSSILDCPAVGIVCLISVTLCKRRDFTSYSTVPGIHISTFVTMLQGPSGRSNKGGEGVQEGSVAPAGRKTLETLGAADSIAEALEMAANERKRHEVSLALLIGSISLYSASSSSSSSSLVWYQQCSRPCCESAVHVLLFKMVAAYPAMQCFS